MRALPFLAFAVLGCPQPDDPPPSATPSPVPTVIPTPGVPTPPTPTPQPTDCPTTGDGQLDVARSCVMGLCAQDWDDVWSMEQVLERAVAELGDPESCGPSDTVFNSCVWFGGDLELAVPQDLNSDSYSIKWALHSAFATTDDGLGVGVDSSCFEPILGPGTVQGDRIRWTETVVDASRPDEQIALELSPASGPVEVLITTWDWSE